MIRTVLFDLDGTLTDSREGIVNSVKYAIEKLGGTMPDQQTLLKFIGPPLQESFMAYCGYDTETAARGVEVFRERYEPVGQYENQPAPGLRELLARLKERGYTPCAGLLQAGEAVLEHLRTLRIHPKSTNDRGKPHRGGLAEGRCHPGGHAPPGTGGGGQDLHADGRRPQI